MRLSCPCCGIMLSLDAMLADACAREVMTIALKLPGELGERVVRYLGFFRAPRRGLAWDRAKRLLLELSEPVVAGQVQRHGRTWPAPLDYWRAALDEILAARDKLQLPLKTHGYLFEIVVGIASRAEDAAEKKREVEARRRPAARDPLERVKEAAVSGEMPQHIRAELDKLGIFQNALKKNSIGVQPREAGPGGALRRNSTGVQPREAGPGGVDPKARGGDDA